MLNGVKLKRIKKMSKIEYVDDGMMIDGDLITWETISLEKTKRKYKDYILIKTETRYGRDYLTCNFIIEESKWKEIKEKIEKFDIKKVCLGEVCGKHSEVMFYPNEDIKEEISDLEEISKFLDNHGMYEANYDGNPYWTLSDKIYELENDC